MPKYTVVENPPPYTQGESSTSFIFQDTSSQQIVRQIFSNKLVDLPTYTVIPKVFIKAPYTVVNTVVVNTTNVDTKIIAEYKNLSALDNITNTTQLINDGLGQGTYDNNSPPIWSTLINKLNCQQVGELLDITLKFKCTTDTLGGVFEIEAIPTSLKIKEDQSISREEQNFNINFKIITTEECISNGIRLYITPEIGMKINLTNFSLFIIKE